MIRRILAFGIATLLVSVSVSAEGTYVLCERTEGIAVPCQIWLVPAEPERPPIEIASGVDTPVEVGRYFVRAVSAHGVLAAPAALVVISTSPTDRHEPDRLRLRPGARVNIPQNLLGNAGAVQLLSLETGVFETVYLSQRRFSVAPSGRAIVVGLDGPDHVAGITRSFEVPSTGAVDVPSFVPPAKGSGHVIVSWRFPATDGPPTDDLVPVLRRGEMRLKPAESRWDHDLLRWAVFYDVPAGDWEAVVESRVWQAAPLTVRVSDSKTVFPDPVLLQRRPALTLRLERYEEMAQSPFSLTLFKVADGECDAKRIEAHLVPRLDADSATLVAERSGIVEQARIEALASGCYVAAFECAGRRTNATVRIEAEDAELSGKLRPIAVEGTLKWSGENGPGALRFTHLNDGPVEDEVEADEAGDFRATLWQPGYFSVRITPADSGPPVTKRLHVPPGTEAMEADFDVPSGTFRYRVVDAASDQPVESASACCLPGLEETLSRVEADVEGRIRFRIAAPSKSGAPAQSERTRLTLTFSAKEYEPETVQVDPFSAPVAEATVRLHRLDDARTFFARLPDGSRASRASVFLIPPGVAADDLARTVIVPCDAEGLCRLGRPIPPGSRWS